RDAVVQATLVGDMAQRVDVGVAVAVVVDSDEVLGKTQRAQSHIRIVDLGHPEFGRVWTVRRRARAERQAEAHDDTASHQARGRRQAVRGKTVRRSELVLCSPASPAAHGAEQLGELRRRHPRVRPGFPLVHAAGSTRPLAPNPQRCSGQFPREASRRWIASAAEPPISIIATLVASTLSAPSDFESSPTPAATPRKAAAGMVVTEIATPTPT